jgi:hypothetical protein
MDKPTASAETLMRQASDTANHYFIIAIKNIDDYFGDGFAKDHPDLIAAHMNAAALDFHAASITAGLWEVAEGVRDISQIIDAIGSQ